VGITGWRSREEACGGRVSQLWRRRAGVEVCRRKTVGELGPREDERGPKNGELEEERKVLRSVGEGA